MNYPEIKAAIFDMDGTLVNSLMYWNTLWEDVGRDWLDVAGFRPSEEIDKRAWYCRTAPCYCWRR